MSADRALAKVAVNLFYLCRVVYVIVAEVVGFVGQLFAQEADVLPPVCQVARVPFVGNEIPVNVSKLHIVLDSVLLQLLNGRVLFEHIARQLLQAQLPARTQAHITAYYNVVSVVKRIDKQRSRFQHFGRVLDALF